MIPTLKSTVSLTGMTTQTGWGMYVASCAWNELFPDKPFVVTSVTDSLHEPGSHHYLGNAFDIRRRDPAGAWALTQEDCERYRVTLQTHLGRNYLVLVEVDHFHVQWKPIVPV